jgi:enamine deaminase RidA (YjgF/YER057c/UK114 family)
MTRLDLATSAAQGSRLAALNVLRVADAASDLLQEVFGKDKSPCRLVYGVASLPLGTPVELEVIFEVEA